MQNLKTASDQTSEFQRRAWYPPIFWWVILAFWLVMSLASALEISILQSTSVREALVVSTSRLLPCILLTPLILWISSVYTLERTTWKSTIWVYIAACLLYLAIVAVVAFFGPPPPLMQGQTTSGTPLFSADHRSLIFLTIWRTTYQLPTFWGLVGVAHAIHFHERNKIRELRESELQARLVQARLQTLRMQMNPHFLFNTLNSIASLVPENPALAEKLIEALGGLLRQTIDGADRQEIPVRDELEFLDRYLLIERVRFGERLSIEKQIDAEVLDDTVPALILQPLVENAMKHGIEEQIAPGVVRISVRPAGEKLRIGVCDNGPGLAKARNRTIREGVGLSNIRARLKELFGGAASMHLHPGELGGFAVTIELPRRRAEKSRPREPELQSVP